MMKCDFKRCFSWKFIAVIIVQPLLYLIPVWDMFVNGNFLENEAAYCFEYSRSVGFGKWLIPLLAAIPGGLMLIEEKNCGYDILLNLRVSHLKYMTSKFVTAVISGALAIVFGYIFYFAILVARFGFSVEFYKFYGGNISSIAYNHFPLYFMSVLYMQVLGGGFWAACAVTYSIYHFDIYYTLAIPLIISRILYIITSWKMIPEWVNISLLIDGEIYMYRKSMIVANLVIPTCIAILYLVALIRTIRRD